MGQWIEGAVLAEQIRAEAACEVRRLKESGVQPGLAVVLVAIIQHLRFTSAGR